MGSLTTVAVARQAVPRLANTTTFPDAEIQRLIDESSDVIQSYLHRTFAAGTYTEVYNSDITGSLFLNQRPITAVTSISTDPPDFATVLDTTSYRFDAATGEVRYGGDFGGYFPSAPFLDWGPFWGCGWQSVQVVYSAGFSTIPAAVVGRCLAVLNRIASTLALQTTLRAKTLGAVSFTYADPMQIMSLTDDDRRILAPYRNYSLG